MCRHRGLPEGGRDSPSSQVAETRRVHVYVIACPVMAQTWLSFPQSVPHPQKSEGCRCRWEGGVETTD